MWRCLVFFISLFTCVFSFLTRAQAGDDTTSPTDFSTLIFASSSANLDHLTDEKDRIALMAESHGFKDMSAFFPKFKRKFGIDQVLVDHSFSKAVFLRFGLEARLGKDAGRIYVGERSDYATTGRSKNGLHYVALFEGFNKTEINPLLLGINHELKDRPKGAKKSADASPLQLPGFSKTALFMRLLEMEAFAAEAAGPAPTCKPLSSKKLKENIDGLNKALDEYGYSCLIDMGSGAFDVGGASFDIVAQKTISLYKGTFLKDTGQEWTSFTSFIANFRSLMNERYQGFFNLPPPKQAEFFCRFLGQLEATGVLMAMTGGSATGLGVAALDAAVAHMESQEDLSDELKKVRCKPQDGPPAAGGSGDAKKSAE